MAWLSDWTKRIQITIDNTNIDSDLSHFPVPVPLGTSVGQDNDDVSAVFDELTSDGNRKKIAVTENDGTTQLYVEIEFWDDANEEALLWVSKSTWNITSASTTNIYLYFDSTKSDNSTYVGDITDSPAQNVWDASYQIVCHMANDPSGGASAVKDSTSNANHLTASGSPKSSNLTDGPIGKAIDFNTDIDYIQIESVFGSNKTALTYEATIYPESAGGGDYGRICDNGKTDLAMGDGHSDTILFEINGSNNWFGTSSTMSKNTWHNIVAHVNGDSQIDLNGSDLGDTGSGNVDANDNFRIGNYVSGSTRGFDGPISEIRFSTTERGSAWRKAYHYSMEDDLLTYGVKEDYSPEINLSEYMYPAVDDGVENITATEWAELANIDATTISSAQWGYLGAMTAQPLEDITSEAIGDLSDVVDTTPSAGDVLIYNATNSQYENSALSDGTLISIVNADGSITINNDDDLSNYDNTTSGFITATLTEEEVEDYVGGMVTGNTETFIDVTYEDGDGTLDFVVPVKDEDDMVSDSATHLSTQQSIKAYVDNNALTNPLTSDLVISTASPSVNFKDTDCTDSDINATLDVSATDTGSGSEDIDVLLRQQVDGSLTTFMKADADGDVEIGDSSRDIRMDAPTTEYHGDIEMSIHDIKSIGVLNIYEQSERTISGGSITVTDTFHTIDTEGDNATDDLDTINGGSGGDILILRADNTTRTVVIKNGTGNIICGSDFSLDNASDTAVFIYDSTLTSWIMISSSNNAI